MDRIKTICSYLGKCESFADVGCDHGYCAEYMLKNNLCEKAVISDVSAKSLNKAETLLASYVKSGRCIPVCCDGLQAVGDVEQVLIAGMGGEEIVKILKEGYIPDKFVFQPMKNAPLLRNFLSDNGCKIIADDIFKDGKFYFIIKGEKGKSVKDGEGAYGSAAQTEFGRDSLKNPLLKEYLAAEIAKNKGYLQNPMSEANRRVIEERIKFLTGVSEGEIE